MKKDDKPSTSSGADNVRNIASSKKINGAAKDSKDAPGDAPSDIANRRLYQASSSFVELIREQSGAIEADEMAGLLALLARDLAELAFSDVPESIERDEQTRELKRFLCSVILDKSPVLSSLGMESHPLYKKTRDSEKAGFQIKGNYTPPDDEDD